ncbi:MAG: hypothetical protein U0931_15730 [Vulcanimicrobiota bacterium]
MSLSVQNRSRDERWEQARDYAAQQQALRLAREQARDQSQPAAWQPSATPPAEAQRIAAGGLVGAKRLARNMEGMLRDKPKFNFFQASERPAQESAPAPRPETQVTPEPLSFVPSPPRLELARVDSRPPRAAEDPASLDLNLSTRNRQDALNQGLPASQTVRAATAMYSRATAFD